MGCFMVDGGIMKKPSCRGCQHREKKLSTMRSRLLDVQSRLQTTTADLRKMIRVAEEAVILFQKRETGA